MADSKIEWCTRSDWNPFRGCTRVSPGCGGPGKHGGCYAEKIAARFSGPGQAFEGFAERKGGEARWTGKIALVEDHLLLPLRWKKPARIFVNSMSDLFHEDAPDEWIDRVFAVMALAPQHVFQILTKRSARMREYMTSGHMTRAEDRIFRAQFAVKPAPGHSLFDWPLPNVWLGVSAEDQRRADERVPDLLATPAAVRFVSAEPLLGGIDLTNIRDPRRHPAIRIDALRGQEHHEDDDDKWTRINRLGWVIGGGESGPRARPMLKSWATSIRDQCAAAGTAYFHKQNGEWIDADERLLFIISQGFHFACGGRTVEPPIGYTDAQALADATSSKWEHHSDGTTLIRVGKVRAGRLLDGIEHNEFPPDLREFPLTCPTAGTARDGDPKVEGVRT